MAIRHDLMTADELLHMPDDGYRYELIQGELHKMSPAGFEHGAIAMRFGVALSAYVQAQRLGSVATFERITLPDADLPRHLGIRPRPRRQFR